MNKKQHRQWLKELSALAIELRYSRVYEDRLEYTPDDFKSAYQLSDAGANILHAMIQNLA